MLDVKIEGGTVFDGGVAEGVRADVGLRGDRIDAVGELAAAPARRTIRAEGRAVAPGFIDVHSHSDAYLLIEPAAPSKLCQGVTTEIVGNCGASAAPLLGAYRMPSDWADKAYPGAWRTVAEYRTLLAAARPAPNVALLIGHNTLRAGVMGYGNRPASLAEADAMAAALERALEEGGIGLSSGLIYAPGMFAGREELIALARVAARRGGIYASHMRSESGGLLAAIEEALAIGRAAGVRVQVSHLKAAGRANWGLLDRALGLLRAARERGEPVAADRYPYLAGATDLDVVFPAWAAEGGRDAVLARLRDRASRARLHRELCASRPAEDWAAVTIGSTTHPDNARFRGMPLTEVADRLGVDPVEAILRLVESDRATTGAFFAGLSEENLRRVLAEPYVMIGSDASLRAPTGPLSHDHPHPRAYGAFARVLRMARDGVTVNLPEAVRKMTGLPAEQFRLRDRGRIRKGAYADVVVFDPETVRDEATYGEPHRPAAGVEWVLVNGTVTVADGRFTGDRAGRFIDG